MEVILGVVFLIAAVSLYDYFSGKKWQQVTSVERNEIVFENRNKEYGAYVLRRDYDKSMVYIMAGVLVTFGLGFGTFIYARSMPDEVVKLPKTEYVGPIDIPEDKPDEIIEPPVKEEVKPLIETTAFAEPVVTDDDKEVTELPVDGELDNKNIGDKDIDGEDIDWTVPDDKDPIDKVIDKKDDEIPTFVDVEATFNDINGYIVRKLVYPQIAIEQGAQGKCYLKFVVNTDGSVSNVSVQRGVPDCPECDAEAVRVIRSMNGWKPAEHNGRLVRSWMTIPINFTLE